MNNMLRFNKFITRPSPATFLRLVKAIKLSKAHHRNFFVRNFSVNNDVYKYDGDVKYENKDTETMRQFFDEHGPLGIVSYGDVCLVETDPVISQAKEN